MTNALSALFLLAAPGLCLVAGLRRHGTWRRASVTSGERLYLLLSTGVLTCAWAALTLAELRAFRLTTLVGLVAGVCGALCLVLRPRIADFAPERPSRACVIATATTILGLVAWGSVFGRPFHWFIGGDDAGTYLNTAAHIANEGGVVIYDSITQQAAPWARGTFYYNPTEATDPLYSRLPYRLQNVGFFIVDPGAGLVVPQSLHAFPALLAAAMATLGPIYGLYALPLLASLGVLGLFFTVRRAYDGRTAALAAGLLFLGFHEQWFARYPASEMLTQAAFFLGTFLLGIASQARSRALSAASAIAFSFLLLVRVDMAFLILPLVLFIAASAAPFERVPRHLVVFIAAFSPLLLQAMAHLILVASSYLTYTAAYNVYFEPVSGRGGVTAFSIIAGGIALSLTAAAVIAAISRWPALGPFLNRHIGQRAPRLCWIISVVSSALLAYGYLVRPHLVPAPFGPAAPLHADGWSLVKLSWYVGPLGLALALAGNALLWLHGRREVLVLLLAGLIYGLAYLYNPFQFPLQPQWGRKLMPIVVPFAAICMAYAATFASERLLPGRKSMALALSVAMCAPVAFQGLSLNRPFARYVEYEGALLALEQLSRSLGPQDAVILAHPGDVGFRFGPPLRYFFGRDVLLVEASPEPRSLRGALEAWREQGRAVRFLSPSETIRRLVPLVPLSTSELVMPEADRPTDGPPKVVGEARISVEVLAPQTREP